MGYPSTDNKLQILVMILIALAVSMIFQGSRGLYESSEGRYAECAREMIESGNYLEPTLDQKPHWSKPPFTYWAIAFGIKLFGPGEWGVRSMNAVAFFLTTLLVAWMGASMWDRRTGIIAGLIYASSLFPVAGAVNLTTDTLLTFWEIFAVLCFIKACHSQSRTKRDLWIVAMYMGLGFGFLTKGPPSLFPLIPILIWRFRTKKPAGLLNPLGLLLFGVTGLLWYIVVCLQHPGLLSYFIGTEVIDRIAHETLRNPEWYGPLIVYLPVILLGGGIWSVYGYRLLLKKKLLKPKVFWGFLREKSYESFLITWIILPLIIFVLVKSRLPFYILPLYAPFTLLVARGLKMESETHMNMGKILLASVVSAAVILCLEAASAVYPSGRDMRVLYRLYQKESTGKDTVAVFDESRLFGLQYYFDGRLKRISITGEESWADETIDDIIRDLDKMPSDKKQVIISRKKNSTPLEQELHNSGSIYRQYQENGWLLYIIQGDRAGV